MMNRFGTGPTRASTATLAGYGEYDGVGGRINVEADDIFEGGACFANFGLLRIMSQQFSGRDINEMEPCASAAHYCFVTFRFVPLCLTGKIDINVSASAGASIRQSAHV
jgi:hypothetical protein